jgi:cobalt/nickel transport system permease protein
MIEEQFVCGRTFIHRLNPQIRILSAGVLSIAIALCKSLPAAGIYLLISVLLVTLAQLNPMAVARRLKPIFWFLLMIWIIVPLTFAGDVLYQFYMVKISIPGVLFCWMITIRSIAILLTFTALIATMTVASLGHGLHGLRVPDKLVFLILMCYRYIAVIQEEYQRLLRAAKFRGFHSRTNLHSYRTFAYLAGMLFVRASRRAERVHQAMRCRGFDHTFHTLDVYPENRLNWIFLMGVVLAIVCLVIFEKPWI